MGSAITPRAVCAAAGLTFAADGYLVVLLAAAVAGRRDRPPSATEPMPVRLAIIVPAHDEERTVGDTVQGLLACDYPPLLRDVIVVADNCSDATAAVAAAAGATVWERTDNDRRGKGHAVAWALERLQADGADYGAFVVVDADCAVSPNLLATVDRRVASGARVVQVRYDVANPDESSLAALRWAAFALMNFVRPLGRTRLGLSAGLLGTGMAFAASVLESAPWRAFSIAEDAELHHALVAAGERVTFAPEAWVRSPMPTTREGATTQQVRWEAGRWLLIRRSVPLLMGAAARDRRAAPVIAAAELVVVPPQSLLAVANVACLAAALGRRVSRRTAVGGAAGQALFVIGGLALAGAPPPVWRALARAPGHAAWKAGLQLRALIRPPRDWVRTTRPSS